MFDMAHYEIEVKSLLGAKEKAEALKDNMRKADPECKIISINKQLNHYFSGNDVATLYKNTRELFKDDERGKFEKIVEKGESFSVRTRQRDDEVLLVVKASIDDGTSENTVSRLEFEEPVSISLDELDQKVLGSGFEYQAKWSREREEYAYKGANICIDRNAGYGYLVEFEKVVNDESEIENVRSELDKLMQELGVIELPQDRLERMFKFYNENWRDYYGTDKTFNIE